MATNAYVKSELLEKNNSNNRNAEEKFKKHELAICPLFLAYQTLYRVFFFFFKCEVKKGLQHQPTLNYLEN
jgi:hypothetical protein